ncbi:MAG TPA: sigma 54-interacting transcriptional regulator, partial [Sandaracinaceae bacterium]
ELDRRGDAARALYNLGNAAALVGDDDLARDAIRRASRWSDELGDAAVSVLSAIVEAELALRSGRIDAARRTLEEACAHERAPAAVRAAARARLAIAYAVQGDVAAARALLEGGPPTDVEHAIARVRVALAEGVDAAPAAEEALALAARAGWESRLRAELVAAEAFERSGRSGDALASLARARALVDRAAASLPLYARSRLRAVPAYQRALGASPPASPKEVGERWRALVGHAKRFAREPRLSRLREAIVDAAIELTDAERGFLVARTPDGALRVTCARAFGADVAERPSESVVARVLDAGRPLVTVDALEDERLDRAASVHAMALRSVLAVPLPLRGARAMALVLDDRARPGAFDEGTVELARDLAELAASALETAEALRRERRERRRLARNEERLVSRIESQARELSELRRRTETGAIPGIVAESTAMRRALALARRVALSDAPVLLRGESGTGKELVARAIHDASARRDGPYVGENVSAIPEALLESTLFGHVRGAFTGAERARRGLFEIADGGTLFLDEIGEMSEAMQAKLLRVLQEGELRPVGGEVSRRVDVRVIAATHRDLEAMVAAGRFRQDLFYRLAVVQVELPPLRQRPEDIAPLVAAFLERHAPGRRVRVDRAAMAALRAYTWPGNVRQLENEIRRALVLCEDVIEVAHLSPAVRGEEAPEPIDELDLKGQVDALERRLIRTALERTSGNQTRAAELLGLSRYGLAKMMKRLALEPSR